MALQQIADALIPVVDTGFQVQVLTQAVSLVDLDVILNYIDNNLQDLYVKFSKPMVDKFRGATAAVKRLKTI